MSQAAKVDVDPDHTRDDQEPEEYYNMAGCPFKLSLDWSNLLDIEIKIGNK